MQPPLRPQRPFSTPDAGIYRTPAVDTPPLPHGVENVFPL